MPEEIRDDYEVLAANFQEARRCAQGHRLLGRRDAEPGEALAELQEALEQLDTPEVQQATENIEAWARENC